MSMQTPDIAAEPTAIKNRQVSVVWLVVCTKLGLVSKHTIEDMTLPPC